MNALLAVRREPHLQYGAINMARLIAIISVLWGHSCIAFEQHPFTTFTGTALQSLVLQLGRSGTVLFFLISGFLLNERFSRFGFTGFVKYRFTSTILPWIIVMIAFGITIILFDPELSYFITHHSMADNMNVLIELFYMLAFRYSFWFIPVFFFSVFILMMVKKYVHELWLIRLMFIVTLIYNVNLYINWFHGRHTTAFFAYISVILLGIHVHSNRVRFMHWCNSLCWYRLSALYIATLAIAAVEGEILLFMHSIDPFASLRLLNILNAFVLFIMILKGGRFYWVAYFLPKRTTYGIFLIHNIVGWFIITATKNYFLPPDVNHEWSPLLPAFLAFVLVLCISYILVLTFLLVSRKKIYARLRAFSGRDG